MNKLLETRHLNDEDKDMKWLILLLLDELVIISTSQLMRLLKISNAKVKRSTIYYKINILIENNLIAYTYEINKNSNRCYYLTNLGHQTIGSMYPFVKLPKSDFQHHLLVNNSLIISLEELNNLEECRMIISERRESYEKQDLNKNKAFVSDYFIEFQKEHKRFQWNFKIEIVIKSRRRYVQQIFPIYINQLNKQLDDRIIFLTPSSFMKTELGNFKKHFHYKMSLGEYPQINANVFERIHIFSIDELSEELVRLEQLE